MSKKIILGITASVAVLVLLIVASCGPKKEVRLPREECAFALQHLKDQTSPLAKRIHASLDSIEIDNEEDVDFFYSTLNQATFELHHSGQSQLALTLHRGLFEILDEASDPTPADYREMLLLLLRLGATFGEAGMPGISLGYYSQGLDLCNDKRYDDFKARFYNNIGVLYANVKLYEKARDYFQKSLELNLLTKNQVEIFLNYSNLAEMAASLGHMDKAQEYIRKSLEYVDAENSPVQLALMRIQEGDISMKQNMYDIAMTRYKNALELFNQEDFKSGMVDSYLHMGDVYLQKNLPDSALYCANCALKISLDSDQPENISSAYTLLSHSYSKLGRDAESIKTLEKVLTLQDSLRNNDDRIRLQKWEILGKQILPITINQPKESHAAIYMTVTFILLILMVVFTYFNLHRRTPVPIDSHRAGEEEAIRDNLTRHANELRILTDENEKYQTKLERIYNEIHSILCEERIDDASHRHRLEDLLKELDQINHEKEA